MQNSNGSFGPANELIVINQPIKIDSTTLEARVNFVNDGTEIVTWVNRENEKEICMRTL